MGPWTTGRKKKNTFDYMSNLSKAAAALTAVLMISATTQAAPPAGSSGQIVIDWNLITVQATKKAGFNSNLGSRMEAIEAIAVYDAVNAIEPIGRPYHFSQAAPKGASAEAAAAGAAHGVLVHYFPAQQPYLDSALANSLKSITIGDVPSGTSLGAASAADIIALRADDGSEPDQDYPGPSQPGAGQYRPTPAGFAPGINRQWATVKPFVLNSPSQFRPGPPPAVGTEAYLKALTEIREMGAAYSVKRTGQQTHIAQFYKQDAELTVNETARELAGRHGSSLQEAALVFLLTDLAEADARIAIWDAKYTYLFWRPVTALNASSDGTVSNGYGAWTPLLSTPPHPDYPCGHCGTVSAGYGVLIRFFGDRNEYTLHTTTPGEKPRVLHSLSDGEMENGWSRVYGGIHYSFDNTASRKLGQDVSAYILSQWGK